MRRCTQLALVAALALAAIAHAAGCKSSERIARTEVLVKLDAGPSVRAEVTRLRVELSRGPSADKLEALDPEIIDVDGKFTWPASLALVPRGGSSELAFAIRVVAQNGGVKIAEVRAESSFRKGKTLLLELFLADECLRFFACGAHETCVASGGGPICVPSKRDPDKLPDFDPTGGAGGSSGSGGADDDAGRADGGPDGSTADAGPVPGCKPSPEDCFDGADNDCDGKADCADSDCGGGATCAPAGELEGLLVAPGTPCPSGFDGTAVSLHRGLIDDGCTGCTCGGGDITCNGADVYYYATNGDCLSDTTKSGGTFVGKVTTCTSGAALGEEEMMFTPVAWRVAPISATLTECDGGGTAELAKAAWTESKKLCRVSRAGTGCGTGRICVPTPNNGSLCAQPTKAGACPSASTASDAWYEGYSDTRSCGACKCATNGGDCDDIQVALGHDYSCDGGSDGVLGGNLKDCVTPTGGNARYSPGAELIGKANLPICEASATESGELLPQDRHDLCCAD